MLLCELQTGAQCKNASLQSSFANESNSQMGAKPARQFPSFRDEGTPHRGAGGPALLRDPCDAWISLMGQPHNSRQLRGQPPTAPFRGKQD